MGTATLSGVNTYTGLTTVSGGALRLSGAGTINGSSAITINGNGEKFLQTSSAASTPAITLSQGTLDGTGSVGAVSVGAGSGAVVAHGNGAAAALTLSALTFNGAATTNFSLAGGATTTPGMIVTGALSTPNTGTGAVAVNVTAVNPWINGTTYDLIGYGSFSGATTDFSKGTIGGLLVRQSATLGNDTSGKFITLTVNGDNPKWTGLDSTAWVVGATGGNSNWKLGTAATATNYIEGDVVLFDDSATSAVTPGAVTVNSANVGPVSATFNNSTINYTLAGSFGITGGGGLVKNGSAQLAISNSNSYTGPTAITAGTLSLTGTLGAGAGGGTAISSAAVFTESSAGVIAGASTLTVTAGTTTLAGVNTYTGLTTLSGGTLNINSNGALGSTSGTIAPLTISGGTLQYAASSTNTDLSGRTVTFGSGGATIDVNGNNVTYANAVGNGGSGSLKLVNSGPAATLTLNGASTFTGGTIISSGILALGRWSAGSPTIVNGPVGTGAITLNLGGTLQINDGTFTVLNPISITGGASGTATVQNAAAAVTTNTLSGAIYAWQPAHGCQPSLEHGRRDDALRLHHGHGDDGQHHHAHARRDQCGNGRHRERG